MTVASAENWNITPFTRVAKSHDRLRALHLGALRERPHLLHKAGGNVATGAALAGVNRAMYRVI